MRAMALGAVVVMTLVATEDRGWFGTASDIRHDENGQRTEHRLNAQCRYRGYESEIDDIFSRPN